jgi:hypothetical protein
MGLALADQEIYWNHTAGSGGSVLATSNDGATVELAESGVCPGALAVGSSTLFWLNDRALNSIPRAGGPTTEVWRAGELTTALALDPARENLYVAAGPVLAKVRVSDGTVSTIASGQPGLVDVATDGHTVYASTGRDGRILAFAADSVDGSPTALVSGQTSVDTLALGPCNVYWTNAVDKTVMAANR